MLQAAVRSQAGCVGVRLCVCVCYAFYTGCVAMLPSRLLPQPLPPRSHLGHAPASPPPPPGSVHTGVLFWVCVCSDKGTGLGQNAAPDLHSCTVKICNGGGQMTDELEGLVSVLEKDKGGRGWFVLHPGDDKTPPASDRDF